MKPFQIILLVAFGFFIVVGVAVFALSGTGGAGDTARPVTLWGTLNAGVFADALSRFNRDRAEPLLVNYLELPQEAFDQTLLEALAEGGGPDLILISNEQVLLHESKIRALPFESYPERTFKDTYVEAGEIFLTSAGVLALPVSIDPLVMYWNRTRFSAEGIALPPDSWDELQTLVPRLTLRDHTGNILKSAVAFGEFANVNHAKEIFLALLFQTGDSVVVRGANGEPFVTLGDRFNYAEVPAEASVRFYTEFSNPVKTMYTWNRALASSLNEFLAGDLAMYFGPSSELFEIQQKNPNLNFDIAIVPQIEGVDARRTSARVFGVAVLNASKNQGDAFRAAALLASGGFGGILVEETGLPPVHRALLQNEPPFAYQSVFNESALIARAFLDPHPQETGRIMRAMIEDVTSGRTGSISESVGNARDKMELLVR